MTRYARDCLHQDSAVHVQTRDISNLGGNQKGKGMISGTIIMRLFSDCALWSMCMLLLLLVKKNVAAESVRVKGNLSSSFEAVRRTALSWYILSLVRRSEPFFNAVFN